MNARGLVAAGVVAVVLAGCGGGESDQAQVEGTVNDFTAAVASGRYKAACGDVEASYAKALASYGGSSCDKGLRDQAQGIRGELGSLTISKVTVTGNSAVVAFAGARGVTFRLTREDGEWRIKEF